MTTSSLGLFPAHGIETDGARVENVAGRASNSNPGHSARIRALASWDPSYPGEENNFHQDYIQRHAPSYVDWLEETADNHIAEREVIGVGAIHDPDKTVQNLVTAQEDGSIRIWEVASSGGQIVGETKPGTLAMATSNKDKETGGIDNISIDSQQRKAYIAISDHLHELDLNTLQVTRKQAFPFHITALSEARYQVPLTVGTNQTLHLFDPRSSYTPSTEESVTRLELIGGTPRKDSFLPQSGLRSTNAAITLEQPGPTSILHLPASSTSQNDETIIVAGRFTSLLTYSRRFWPKTTSTLFSGARLSSLTYLPYPYVPRSLTQTITADPSLSLSTLDAAKAASGFTLIAAGEYKGKGSLELYGLPRGHVNEYRNRQTASRTRLIAVATHGTSVVFSDGDGNMKWVERDGSTLVREQSISAPADRSRRSSVSSSRSFGAGAEAPPIDEDIVQRILPVRLASSSSAWPDDLVVQTGDGKVGVLGFGRRPLQWRDTTATGVGLDDENETLEEKAARAEVERKEGEERKFGRMMREALQRQADEVRWLGGLGLGRRM